MKKGVFTLFAKMLLMATFIVFLSQTLVGQITHIVISQVYGGGGNAGATYKNDFVELFNPTSSTVSLAGWSVQYTSAAGTTWTKTDLTGSIAPGRYFLIQEALGAGGTVNLPTPDVIGTIPMGASNGKIALANNGTVLSGSCPTGGALVDFVGYGTANCFEGVAATPAASNTTSVSRGSLGFAETDNNSIDFTAGIVNPRNTLSTPSDGWYGTTSTAWSNTANWSTASVPTIADNTIILSGTTFSPIVDLDPATPAICNALIINTSANLTIAAAKALTAIGATTNNGIFLLQSDATGTGSFIDNGITASTGIFDVEKYLTGSGGSTPNGNYWYIGAPVPATNSGVFTAAGDNRLWSYSEGPSQGYTEITDNTTSLVVKNGYVARLGATETIHFSGTSINNGNFSHNLTGTPSTTYEGFNLICNPYPSAINIENCVASASVENTMWYRSAGNFSTYNWLSHTGQGTPVGQQYVPAMQAFWVHLAAGQTTGTLDMSLASRVHNSQPFYKKTSTNVFRMEAHRSTFSDEMVVGFFPAALDTYEGYDSQKMFSTDVNYPQVYSLTSDNFNVAINGESLLAASEDRVVAVGFKTGIAGQHSLVATNLADFDPSISVYLEDTQLSILQDLRSNNTYSFSSGITDDITRFKLHFGTLTTTSISNLASNSAVTIYENNNSIYVNTHDAGAGLIEIYDMLGKQIMSQQLVKGLNVLQPKVVNGIYIVKVLTDGKSITQKVTLSE
jgi:hypothetical protein